ncbi:MAG: hypothetical protein OXG96_02960 [Acidobacteria bacterium]|nr:hypothetical protein [Acidobacteriota bacterium]
MRTSNFHFVSQRMERLARPPVDLRHFHAFQSGGATVIGRDNVLEREVPVYCVFKFTRSLIPREMCAIFWTPIAQTGQPLFKDAPPDYFDHATTLVANWPSVEFFHEAGLRGYGVYSKIAETGHDCLGVAPSRFPRAGSERVKTDRRDAVKPARLHQLRDLGPVWVPGEEQEAKLVPSRARAEFART